MRRRDLLGTGLAGAVAALAGCVSGVGDPEPAAPGGNGTDGNRTTTAGGDGDVPAVDDSSFEVRNRGCGTAAETATVDLDESAAEVTVDGTTTGSNACFTAELADATVDPDVDALWVAVETREEGGAGACAQCLTEIDYRARFALDGGVPTRVVVTHDGSVVTG